MITPQTIQRAKQKAEKIKEDQSDAPIINVVLSLEQIEEKERAVLEEIERRKQIQEAEVAKVIDAKDKLVDEEGFLAAQQLVSEKAPFLKLNGAFGKIVSGIWKDLSGVPRKIAEKWLRLEWRNKLLFINFSSALILSTCVASTIANGASINDFPDEREFGCFKIFCYQASTFLAFVASVLFTDFLEFLFYRYVDKK